MSARSLTSKALYMARYKRNMCHRNKFSFFKGKRRSRKISEKQIHKPRHIKFRLAGRVRKEIITEIQESTISSILSSPPKRIFSKELKRSIEIVEKVVETDQDSETDKLQEELEPPASPKLQSRNQSLKVAEIRSKSRNNELKSIHTIKEVVKEEKAPLEETKKSCLTSCKQRIDSQDHQTDCKKAKNKSSRSQTLYDIDPKSSNRLVDDSTIKEPNKKILLEEESHQKHRNYPSLKRFGLISLVTEIESSSDESQSSEEEKKSDSDDTSPKNSSRKIIFSNKKNTSFILSFKCCKSTLQVTLDSSYYPQSENQRETQSFKCFKEIDTITYDNFKPLKLPDGLIKGDDDEDSEPEDVIRGQKFLKLHIESELEARILYLRKK